MRTTTSDLRSTHSCARRAYDANIFEVALDVVNVASARWRDSLCSTEANEASRGGAKNDGKEVGVG